MKRSVAILLFCISLPMTLMAQPSLAAQTTTFDSPLAASVWSAALAYIEPRALDPVTIPQMAMWGLNSLAGIDPNLNTILQDGQIRLFGPNQMILAITAPSATNATAWGVAAAKVAAAAYAVSQPIQQVGTQGIISNFFDELFNHFDPYSRYEPPSQAAQEQLIVVGLASTGVTLDSISGKVLISRVAADSPAGNAGLEPGMVVTAINGQHVYPGMVTRLNSEMEGVPGSHFSINFVDPLSSDSGVQSVTLQRDFIPPQTVFVEPSLKPGLAVLRISGFNKGTGDQFAQTLASLMSHTPPPSGLVLDLRGNRGGVLRQAVLVADSLLNAGEIIKTTGRDPDADQNFLVEGADITDGAKVVVLVDGQTASAAEVLSSALADNGRAVVIGSETLGKGLVQTITSLPDGGELFVTWSRMLAPRGWPLQGLGLMPQICTSNGSYSLSQQLAALQNGHNLMAPILAKARAMRPPVGIDAILALRDKCPADIGGELDEQAALAVLSNDEMYRAALLR